MSLLGLMVGTTACEDNKDEFLSDYATTMYIRNSGEQAITCYITGEDTKYNLSVVKAGNDEKALSDAEISVMDAAQLAVYNSENATDYIMLPSNCYEFNTETVSDMDDVIDEIVDYVVSDWAVIKIDYRTIKEDEEA